MISEYWTFGLQNLFVRTRQSFFLTTNLRTKEPSDYADRYAFIASVALFMICCRKKTKGKRKTRSHKGRGLARCRRRKIDAMIAVELGARG